MPRGRAATAKPVVVEEEEEDYEVKEIKNHKRDRKGLSYFVSWVGYTDEDDLWISEDSAAYVHFPRKTTTKSVLRDYETGD